METAPVPIRWVLLFALVTLGVLAVAVQFVGGSLVGTAGLLGP